MGPFSFCKKSRKSRVPDRLELGMQNLTLLDRFSQEIGSPRSASGWVVPDSILSPATPTWSSPNGNTGNSSLGMRGGEMQDFQDCDPNSPTSLERYLFWIDEDYYDEQFAMRQDQGNAQRVVQLTEQGLHGEFVSPSADDFYSDSDESGGCPLVPPPSISSVPNHRLYLGEYNDVDIAAAPSIGQWLHNLTIQNMSQVFDNSADYDDEDYDEDYDGDYDGDYDDEDYDDEEYSDEEYSDEDYIAEDYIAEDCEYDADIESLWSINRSILAGSDLPDRLDRLDYEEFEAAQCHCYDSLSDTTAASQSSMSICLCQESAEDEEEYSSCDGILDSPTGRKASASDFRTTSEDIRYFISRFQGFCDSLFRSKSTHYTHRQHASPPFPTAVLCPSLLPIDGIQSDSGLLRSGLGFSPEFTNFETQDTSLVPLLFGQSIVDRFMFTFNHNGPRYPS